ncbi:MAG: saccharopine dehydrogenase [Bacteroidetes bacterium]|nr:MAG: saccharopine dehydrogenase [Bacteroidota bacterium]
MKKILVIGAGLSSSYLIKYLIEQAAENQWTVTIADNNMELAQAKAHESPFALAMQLNANDQFELEQTIAGHDLVISLLPPTMHVGIAKICIKYKKHLITASYVSSDMHHLHVEALKANVLLLNECGLDPGIDHLSAMKIIDGIKAKGGVIDVFKSYCGGLIAPEFDTNPWNYKFTWNPRNVVLAGQATAKYLENGALKFIPASRIFTQTETLEVNGYGAYESYANRDSLGYIKPYGLEQAHTVLRGTLRKKGFSEAWNLLVKLGLTDDTQLIEDADKITFRQLVSAFTPGTSLNNLEQRVCAFLTISPDGELFNKLKWLGIFEDTPINLREATPAAILQMLLQQKWKLQKGELDMIVMQHVFEATINNRKQHITSSLVVKGENETLTAMAKTVGLPMGIAAKLVLNNQIKLRGVQIPLSPELYTPILNELTHFGIVFNEEGLD